jgi:hypothetical protein
MYVSHRNLLWGVKSFASTPCHLTVAHIWYYYQISKRQLMFLEMSIYLIVIFILPFLKSKVGRPDFWINALLLLHDKVPDTNRPICNEPGKKIKQRIGRGQIESSDAGRWKFRGVPVVKGGQNLPPLVGIGWTYLQNIGGGSPPPPPLSSGINGVDATRALPLSLLCQLLVPYQRLHHLGLRQTR